METNLRPPFHLGEAPLGLYLGSTLSRHVPVIPARFKGREDLLDVTKYYIVNVFGLL
jgi:hypothetical protein